MRFVVHAALLLAVSASPAFAQRGPVFVVPGKPGVPVIINGVDASWAVVEGEFGLNRPGQVTPTVIARPLAVPIPYYVPGYYPATGRRPGYGRYEIVPPPNRPLPPEAPTYYRNWSSQSESGEVTQYAPFTPPPVIVAPRVGRDGAPQGPSHGRL
jgi:hypothetical protein